MTEKKFKGLLNKRQFTLGIFRHNIIPILATNYEHCLSNYGNVWEDFVQLTQVTTKIKHKKNSFMLYKW
jgi:hypothetical protein